MSQPIVSLGFYLKDRGFDISCISKMPGNVTGTEPGTIVRLCQDGVLRKIKVPHRTSGQLMTYDKGPYYGQLMDWWEKHDI